MEIQATKAYLKANKITYEQLSERSGIPLNTLKNIFSGRTEHPRIDTMQAIKDALGLNQADLQITNTDKTAGIEPRHKQILSPDEMDLLDVYRALKDEKGERAAHAVKTIIKAFLDEN